MDPTMNITRTDLHLPTRGGRPPHVIRPDALPQSLFVAEVLGRRLAHVARDSFRGTSPPGKLAELSTPMLIRTDPDADEVEAFVRLAGGEPALIETGYNHVRIEVAAETSEAARAGAVRSPVSRRLRSGCRPRSGCVPSGAATSATARSTRPRLRTSPATMPGGYATRWRGCLRCARRSAAG
jgi:hypothetical protein